MKIFKIAILPVAFLLIAQSAAFAFDSADRDKALSLFKKYVNNMVQRVEKLDHPDEKRAVLNNSFDNLISVFETVQGFGFISPKDKEALEALKANIIDKKNELNGLDGYNRVADNRLNNFANFVQQDLEQADTVTITISATLLVIIIVLLLLL